ncbi:hypothetical protein PoB_005785200 [Plakobranchus ocellatus]|uniref:Uncharacterized protein n=1 Tax=Plakobranchus ocellatus TaxID=259542 RepID=A0AAV4CI81_9GAST|nr:hypothetical protein PoB_005785200 [Plakobranchus ocellatus]
MVLDDNNSNEYNVDCGSDDSTVDKLDREGASEHEARTEMPGPANDSSLSRYIEVSSPPNEDIASARAARSTVERNLWLDLAVDSSLSSITPTLHMEDK